MGAGDADTEKVGIRLGEADERQSRRDRKICVRKGESDGEDVGVEGCGRGRG